VLRACSFPTWGVVDYAPLVSPGLLTSVICLQNPSGTRVGKVDKFDAPCNYSPSPPLYIDLLFESFGLQIDIFQGEICCDYELFLPLFALPPSLLKALDYGLLSL
jgi:hypothetical protein